MENQRPTPSPRNNTPDKKPVPLPRKTIAKINVSTEKSNDSAVEQCSLVSNDISEQFVSDEIKINSKPARERGRNVIEPIKDVGSKVEKSVRCIMGKRKVSSFGGVKQLENTDKHKSNLSLPAEDIFQSITFNSPLSAEYDPSSTIFDNVETEDQTEFNAPPPVYPPPPLPDESVYDEVQSVKSSILGSSKHSISQLQQSTHDLHSEITTMLPNTLHEDMHLYCVTDDNAEHLYDSSLIDDKFRKHSNVMSYVCDSVTDKDCLSYTSNRALSTCSLTSPLLSELDGLEYNSNDENTYSEHSSTSVTCSNNSDNIDELNDLYEQCATYSNDKSFLRSASRRTAPSKSVIVEFDPLFNNTIPDNLLNLSNKELVLANCATKNSGDFEKPYGKINKISKTEPIKVESENDRPPIPPRRFDSINLHTEEIDRMNSKESIGPLETPSSSAADSISKKRRATGKLPSFREAAIKLVKPLSATGWSSNILRQSMRMGVSTKDRNLLSEEEKKHLESSENSVVFPLTYSGSLYKVPLTKDVSKQDCVERWCVLAEGKFVCYSDKVGLNIKESIKLKSILSIQSVMDHKVNSDGDCFELHTVSKIRNNIYGTSGPTERRVWMQKILESLTIAFPHRLTIDFIKAGWCFLKEGINGPWVIAWILLKERWLFYCCDRKNVEELDLRKARFIGLQYMQEKDQPDVAEDGPFILIDSASGHALYLKMETIHETSSWRDLIQAAAVNNGLNLAQQQLTKDDLPVIVDKCVNFVYAHGSMSEGIYRRSGTNSNVSRLLSLFRKDAWNVQLSHQEYTEYEVANVLKRFFRELPDCLLTSELYGEFCDIAAGKYGSDHRSMYMKTLEKLPSINYLTTRKLIGHLHFIDSEHEVNLMPVENLASVWSPTLLHLESSESLESSKLESIVIAELIAMYPELFNVDDAEIKREEKMKLVLEKYHASNSNTPQSKQSGEFKMWIYLESKESGQCINMSIGPQKLAGDVCSDLSPKMNCLPHQVCLEEHVCQGNLVRPLHHTEKVLDVILRWGYWDALDCKDNALILRRNSLFEEISSFGKLPISMCGELRFADQKSKSFKQYLFEFTQAKLCCYKDKRGSMKLNEWKIEEIIWYIGHEPKRNPQMRWSITFIDKNKQKKRSKESPYFGYTIAGITREEQLRWMAAMFIGEYPQGILPSPSLI